MRHEEVLETLISEFGAEPYWVEELKRLNPKSLCLRDPLAQWRNPEATIQSFKKHFGLIYERPATRDEIADMLNLGLHELMTSGNELNDDLMQCASAWVVKIGQLRMKEAMR